MVLRQLGKEVKVVTKPANNRVDPAYHRFHGFDVKTVVFNTLFSTPEKFPLTMQKYLNIYLFKTFELKHNGLGHLGGC